MDVSQSQMLLLRLEVVVTVIEEGAVALDLDTKYFYTVNPMGWKILQMFEVGTTLEQVHAQCRRWGMKPDDPSLAKFLDVIVGDKLVTPTDLPPVEQELISGETWSAPLIEKAKEPLQRIMTSAFDPTMPLAE